MMLDVILDDSYIGVQLMSTLYTCTISTSPAGFVSVVTATAHPATIDGLIGLQMAIKVLL